jgi:hypothetical protein
MKNIFSSGRRKFFGLLAGVAALPLAATQKRVADETPELVKKHATIYRVSDSVGIGVNGPSGTFDVVPTSSGLPKIT